MESLHFSVSSQFLTTLGIILLCGLLISALGQRTLLPRATLLILFGVIIGGEMLDLVPRLVTEQFSLVADLTLLMVGFLLGGKLTRSSLQDHSKTSFAISLSAALVPAALVFAGMLALGVGAEVAILLGCFAAATAPAAVFDVVEESGVRNRFSELLLLVVVLDDVWGLLLFGIGMAVVSSLSGSSGDAGFLVHVAHELGGAILLGAVIGLPAAYLTGRIRPGKPIMSEAIGIVLLCGGLATLLQVSYLIAAITMGAVITNLARHHEHPFHAIEGIESMFMLVFFVLAGASLEIGALPAVGMIAIAYILCRSCGKLVGAWLGSRLGGAETRQLDWVGAALLPQAGIAIGMALVASNHFPHYHRVMLPIVIASTIVFEIAGPVFTRYALRHSRDQPGS
jgi:Kef-type K+ transport system membrane component KefB